MLSNSDATSARSAAAAADRLRNALGQAPALAVVLGSGFGTLAAALESPQRLGYDQIPGFPVTTVTGHAGQVIAGQLDGCPLWVLSGRGHYYEGNTLAQVTFPIRVLAVAGCQILLMLNAAGGINPHLHPGDFMIVTDHINWIGDSPLRGGEWGGRDRFVDLSAVYDPILQRCLRQALEHAGRAVREGVYLAVAGPNYETPAEIRAFARLGADAIGMSTVPEAIVARQCGLRVAALSCITNLAAGHASAPLSHAEVLASAERVGETVLQIVRGFVRAATPSSLGP